MDFELSFVETLVSYFKSNQIFHFLYFIYPLELNGITNKIPSSQLEVLISFTKCFMN